MHINVYLCMCIYIYVCICMGYRRRWGWGPLLAIPPNTLRFPESHGRCHVRGRQSTRGASGQQQAQNLGTWPLKGGLASNQKRVCVHIYIYVHMYVCIYVCINVYIYIYTFMPDSVVELDSGGITAVRSRGPCQLPCLFRQARVLLQRKCTPSAWLHHSDTMHTRAQHWKSSIQLPFYESL